MRPVTWLELSIVAGLVVLLLSRVASEATSFDLFWREEVKTSAELKWKWGAFALLTLGWTEAEASLWRISPEPDFWVAIRTAWEAVTGPVQHDVLPSLVIIGFGRSIYIMEAASLSIGIYVRRGNLAKLSIPRLIPVLPVFPKVPDAREINRPRRENAMILVEVVLVGVDLFLLLLNIAVTVFCLVSNFLFGAIERLANLALRILDITARTVIYPCCLVALIALGTVEALWLSLLEALRSLAVACLLWLAPFAIRS